MKPDALLLVGRLVRSKWKEYLLFSCKKSVCVYVCTMKTWNYLDVWFWPDRDEQYRIVLEGGVPLVHGPVSIKVVMFDTFLLQPTTAGIK